MVYTGPEKRKYKRVKHPFTARFRIYQKERSKESCKWDIVTIRDLSAGGLCFNYNRKIALGAILEFSIRLPFSLKSVYCLGEVLRIDENHRHRPEMAKIPVYGIAVRFIEIEDDKREAIDKLAKEFFPKEDDKTEK